MSFNIASYLAGVGTVFVAIVIGFAGGAMIGPVTKVDQPNRLQQVSSGGLGRSAKAEDGMASSVNGVEPVKPPAAVAAPAPSPQPVPIPPVQVAILPSSVTIVPQTRELPPTASTDATVKLDYAAIREATRKKAAENMRLGRAGRWAQQGETSRFFGED